MKSFYRYLSVAAAVAALLVIAGCPNPQNGDTNNVKRELLYKPDFPAHQTKFSLGDFDSDRLFLVKGLPAGDLTREIVIKEGSETKFTAATDGASLTVPDGGEVHFGINGITYANWTALNDAEHTIDVVLKRDAKELLKETFTVTKSPDGSIYTWRDLQNIQNKMDGDYSLVNDVALPDPGTKGLPDYGFRPLGYNTGDPEEFPPHTYKGTPFSGSLAGNGRTIGNFSVDTSKAGFSGSAGSGIKVNDLFVGLFGVIEITNSAKSISNLTIDVKRLNVTGESGYLGALAGELKEGAVYNVTVSGSEIKASRNVGGLVGSQSGGTLTGTNNAAVEDSGTNSTTGGLAGNITNGTLAGVNKGTVTGHVNNLSGGAGGLAGYANVTAGGTLVIRGINSGNVSDHLRPGGLLGEGSDGALQGIVSSGVIVRKTSTDFPKLKAGYLAGSLAGTNVVVNGYWGTPGTSTAAGLAAAAIGSGTPKSGDRRLVADPSKLEKRADGKYYLDDGRPGTTTAGTEVFQGFTFGTAVGEWTWTDGEWPSINLVPPTN